MAKELKPGDKVEWDSSGGHSVGKVVKKQTTPTKIKGHKVAASKDDPRVHRQERQVGQAGRAQGERPEEGLRLDPRSGLYGFCSLQGTISDGRLRSLSRGGSNTAR